MRRARLNRRHSGDQGTFGQLLSGRFACFTGELPQRGNRPNVSCIPEGDYRVIWALSPRLKRYTFRLVGVPSRAGILEHSANLMGDPEMGYVAQLNGCIALGEALGTINGQAALLRSKPAVRLFENFMNHEPHILEIRNA